MSYDPVLDRQPHPADATIAGLRAEIAELRAALDRYRYVYAWWTADSHDSGGEFRARMHWARGEDYHHLTNDEVATIGKRFLACTGRAAQALEQKADDNAD